MPHLHVGVLGVDADVRGHRTPMSDGGLGCLHRCVAALGQTAVKQDIPSGREALLRRWAVPSEVSVYTVTVLRRAEQDGADVEFGSVVIPVISLRGAANRTVQSTYTVNVNGVACG